MLRHLCSELLTVSIAFLYTKPCMKVLCLLLTVFLLSSTVTAKELCIESQKNKHCFKVELADSKEERERGLMYRVSLPKDAGMLFDFKEEGIYPFWMKNTWIYLDIIWIDKDNRIVDIAEKASPCLRMPCDSYIPDQKAVKVLEINGGLVKDYGIKRGDTVK